MFAVGPRPRRSSRRRSVALTTVALATALLASACDDDTSSPTGTAATGARSADAGCARESTVGAQGSSLLPVPPARVDVLDPGRQPRVVPVGAPDRSSAQHVRLSTTSVETPVGRGASPGGGDSQTVDMTVTSRVLCGDPTGVELRLDAVSSPDLRLSGTAPSAAGTRAGLAVTSGAVPIALRIVPAPDADDTARAAVEQALVSATQRSLALPREPIGIGARWRAVRTLSGAVTLTQTVTATLRERAGSRLTIDLDVAEEPVDSRFVLPDGRALIISAFSMSGRGSVSIDLTRGLPVDGSLTMRGARTLVGADVTRPLTQTTTFAVRYSTP